jgi:RNA polymerase primary sigma factor
MVAVNTRPAVLDDDVNFATIRPLKDRRNRTAAAARHSRDVAKWITTGEGEAPNESELFCALQGAAYRASRKKSRRPIPESEMQEWANRWKLIRDHIIEQNLGLVYTMISRFSGRDLDWDEQRSDALFAMIRAVDGFNPWCGFRFSTYACNAITRSLIHLSKRTSKRRNRFPVEHEAWLERPLRVDRWGELYTDRLQRALQRNLGELTEREAAVLGWRFPLQGGPSLTLGEIGAAIGLSKERARQIQEQALSKLRSVLESDSALI